MERLQRVKEGERERRDRGRGQERKTGQKAVTQCSVGSNIALCG